jgi:hypothetical protein
LTSNACNTFLSIKDWSIIWTIYTFAHLNIINLINRA